MLHDLVENKIILGEKLEPLQASMLMLDGEFVTSVGTENTQLGTEQRKEVRDCASLLDRDLVCHVIRQGPEHSGGSIDRLELRFVRKQAHTDSNTWFNILDHRFTSLQVVKPVTTAFRPSARSAMASATTSSQV